MKRSPLAHLSDGEVSRTLHALIAEERRNTAVLLSRIGEIEARGLHREAGYSSVEEFFIQELKMDEEELPERVIAARAARRFPVLFHAVSDGRLHVPAVVLLSPHLTQENVEELIAAATHKTEPEIRQLLVERFGQQRTDRQGAG